MGSGFKNFTAEVATSADIDNYCVRQSIMSFATTAARDSALSGNLEEGMHAFNRDTDELWFYNGTTWKRVYTQWVTYTPTWTNLTVGNGTQVARLRYIAGDLRMRGKLTWGSTTSASSTIYQTIANSETADAAGGSGVGALNDTGTRIYPLVCDIAASDTQINFFHAETGGVLTNTSPVTLATGDEIRWDITVPVA